MKPAAIARSSESFRGYKGVVAAILCTTILLPLLSSCKIYAPVYKRVENFRLERIDNEGFKVYGDLILYNPNKVPAKITDVLLNVELNGKHVATAGQKIPTVIHPRSEFSIPVKLSIKPDMSFLDGLKNIFSILITHTVDVTLKGVVVIKAFGIRLSIPVDETEKVDVTKLR